MVRLSEAEPECGRHMFVLPVDAAFGGFGSMGPLGERVVRDGPVVLICRPNDAAPD